MWCVKQIKYILINELCSFSMVASDNLTTLFCLSALKHSKRHMCMYGGKKQIPRKLPATQIQLLALILLSLLYPLMSLIMLIPMPVYNIVEEGSHLYVFLSLGTSFWSSCCCLWTQEQLLVKLLPSSFQIWGHHVFFTCRFRSPFFVFVGYWRT